MLKAAGLLPLGSTTLAAGSRELRVWTGIAIGWPHEMYRISIERGRVTGQWIRYWPLGAAAGERGFDVPMSAILRYSLEGECEAIRSSGDAQVCIARFLTKPNWDAILREVEADDVWTLPDQKELPADEIMVMDGDFMSVETRDGAHYRNYGYVNPGSHPQRAAKHADAISRAFMPLSAHLSPSAHTKVFRGMFLSDTSGAGPDFVACGSSIAWGIMGELGPLAPRQRDPNGDTLVDSVRRAYVEVRGMKAYPGLVKEWRSLYPEIIEVDSMMTVKPWRPEECRRASRVER